MCFMGLAWDILARSPLRFFASIMRFQYLVIILGSILGLPPRKDALEHVTEREPVN